MLRKKPRILSLFGVIFAAIIIVAAGAALGGLTGAAPARGMGKVTGRATGWVINIPAPTGVPETDWQNIQTALDNMQPGDTIQLQPGLYKVHKPVYKEGFSGTFKGAGKDVTTIEAVRSTNDEGFSLVENAYWPGQPFMGVIIEFVFPLPQGDVNISDLTLQAGEGPMGEGPMDPWAYYYYPYAMTTSLETLIDISGGNFNSFIENVNFNGGPGDFYGSNISHCIFLCGGTINYTDYGVGDHSIKSCELKNGRQTSYEYMFWKDSRVVVEGNTFTNHGFGAYIYCINNCDVEISRNEFMCSPPEGMWLDAVLVYTPGWFTPLGVPLVSDVLIQHNKFTVEGATDAIYIADYGSYVLGGGVSLNAIILNNDITLNGAEYGGIYLERASNTIVANNKISGSSVWEGIQVDGGSTRRQCDDCLLKANNLNNLTTAYGAKIWLGPNTSGCTIIGGGNNKFNVADEGVDNYITGVNKQPRGAVGSAVSEAMQRKRAMLEEMRK